MVSQHFFDTDEKGNSGWDISQQALENAKGGTMVPNLNWDYPALPGIQMDGKPGCCLETSASPQAGISISVSLGKRPDRFCEGRSARKHYEGADQ